MLDLQQAVRRVLLEGSVADAEALINGSAHRDPKDTSDAHFVLGKHLYRTGDRVTAKSSILKAIQGGSVRVQVDAITEFAKLSYEHSLDESTLQTLQTVAAQYPNDAKLLLSVSKLLLSNGYVEQGRTTIRSCLRTLKGKDIEQLASTLRLVSSKVNRATSDEDPNFCLTRDALSVYPESPDLQRNFGDTLARMRRFDQALHFLTLAFDGFPSGHKREAARKSVAAIFAAEQQALPERFAGVNPGEVAAPAYHKAFSVAAITNVYNETHNMPVWLGHYGRQVGIKQCIVLDHGSNDGSTDEQALQGAGVVRLSRGLEFNEHNRMRLINDMANSLLGYYDAVIYSDCDEMFVVDPGKYENIVDYARQMTRPVSFAIGLNVRHDPFSEPDLEDGTPILQQRTLVQFVSPMCKPILIRKPVSWGGGFHCCQHPPSFDDAYLFHLRHADMSRALARLNVTREIKFARDGGGKHHRRDASDLIEKVYHNTARYKVAENFDFTQQTEQFIANAEVTASGRYSLVKRVNGRYLHRIAKRFRTLF